MRKLLKSGILRHDDIIKKPERFFLAHRLLAFHSPQLGPGMESVAEIITFSILYL